MKARLISAWTFVIVLGGLGCATPTPVVRLSAETAGSTWVAGRETIVEDQEGVKVAAAFERGTDGVISLRVELQNESEQPVEISPSRIWYRRCHGASEIRCDAPLYVQDPEVALDNIDQRTSGERASAANSESFMGGLILLSAIAEVATAGSGHHHHHEGSNLTTGLHLSSDLSARHAASAESLETSRQMWANVALRRTSVPPGGGAGGQVFLPADMTATFLRLTVEVAERRYDFIWRQQVLKRPVPRDSQESTMSAERPRMQW